MYSTYHYGNEKATTSLAIAAANGHLEVVKQLINHGTDMETPDSTGKTALLLACENRHTDVAKYLIRQGVDVFVRNNRGYSALYIAAEIGDLELVELLLEYCADVEVEREIISPVRAATDPQIRHVLRKATEPLSLSSSMDSYSASRSNMGYSQSPEICASPERYRSRV